MNFFKKFNKLKNDYKDNNISVVSLLVCLFGVLALTFGTSYAYLSYTAYAEEENYISAGTLLLNFNDNSDAIYMSNAVPQRDQDALENNPEYSFTIRNNGTLNAKYEVRLVNVCNEGIATTSGDVVVTPDVCIPLEYIKVGVKQGDSEYAVASLTNDGKFYIGNGTLDANASSIEYKIKIWLDERTPDDYQSELNGVTRLVTFIGQLELYGEQMPTDTYDNLSPRVQEILIEKQDSVALANNDTGVRRLSNAKLAGNWVEATSIKSGDKIRFRVIYNKSIMGTVPTLGFKIGDSKNNLTEGTINDTEIFYEYIVKDSESGLIIVTGLIGGEITDLLGNKSLNEINHIELPEIVVEEVSTGPVQGTLAYAILGKNNSNIVTSGDGLYVSTETNDGSPTYYYKGDVQNNYVSFANTTWRVVRINEDGTIRMILQNRISDTGVSTITDDNDENISGVILPNMQQDEVQLIPTAPSGPTLEEGHYVFSSNGSYTKMYYSVSSVKTTLNNWYVTYLSSYASHIATSTYCEAAKVKYASSSTSGNAIMATRDSYAPDFRCVEDDGNGYGLITDQKIGLITIDEYLHVSDGSFSGDENYLTLGDFWTMSPAGFDSSIVYIWIVSGSITNRLRATGSLYLRPVINLKVDTLVSGLGTSGDPWVVQTN